MMSRVAPDWKESVTELMILEMLRLKGFSKVDELSVKLLKELFISSLRRLMGKVKEISENNHRPESNIFDLLKALESDGYEINGLIDYTKKNKDRFKDSRTKSDSNLISLG